MEQEKKFVRKKSKEWYRKSKYLYLDIISISAIVILSLPTIWMLLSDNGEVMMIRTPTALVTFPIVVLLILVVGYSESKREGKVESYIEKEKIKEIKKVFEIFREEEMNEVNKELKNIVLDKERMKNIEIEKINNIINELNALYKDDYQNKTYLLEEKTNEFVKNLRDGKYIKKNEFCDNEDFNEKQKLKIERMIKEFGVTELKSGKIELTISHMKKECEKIIKELNKIGIEEAKICELQKYLEKIEEESERIKKENIEKINMIYEKLKEESEEKIKKTNEKAEKIVMGRLKDI